SSINTSRIDHLYQDPHDRQAHIFLHYGDLTDGTTLRRIIEHVKPQEIYNLGAQSHVRVSFDTPEYTADVVALGALRLLEAVRDYLENGGAQVKFYQAGSSEMFGSAPPPQREDTAFRPVSPYAVSKVAAFWHAVGYRQSYGLHVVNGILFNHESPRRGETFVTRKVTRAVGRIHLGLQTELYLGNLDSFRDWGYALDYVEAMWKMMQVDKPDDYVVATGESHSVREFVSLAFARVGLDWEKYVKIDPRYFRPTEVDHLRGDASKAREKLGWEPTVPFGELVAMMVDADLELARQEHTLRSAGFNGGSHGVDGQ
ncbi:MAG: GDP-mannose 4,6-dehydratase, partial [Sulfobacillus sp.]